VPPVTDSLPLPDTDQLSIRTLLAAHVNKGHQDLLGLLATTEMPEKTEMADKTEEPVKKDKFCCPHSHQRNLALSAHLELRARLANPDQKDLQDQKEKPQTKPMTERRANKECLDLKVYPAQLAHPDLKVKREFLEGSIQSTDLPALLDQRERQDLSVLKELLAEKANKAVQASPESREPKVRLDLKVILVLPEVPVHKENRVRKANVTIARLPALLPVIRPILITTTIQINKIWPSPS